MYTFLVPPHRSINEKIINDEILLRRAIKKEIVYYINNKSMLEWEEVTVKQISLLKYKRESLSMMKRKIGMASLIRYYK